jgi:hypothetical protein
MMDQSRLGQLFELFHKYGPIPRRLFDLLRQPIGDNPMNSYEVRLSEKVVELLRRLPTSSTQFVDDDPHAIFTINSTLGDSARLKYISTRKSHSVATPYIGRIIGSASDDESKRGARTLYNWMLGQPQTRTSAGWVFEGRVHAALKAGGQFPLQRLSGDVSLPSIRIDSGDTFTTLDNLASHLCATPRSPKVSDAVVGIYQHPARGNLAPIGSMVVVSLRNIGLQPVLFQIAIAAQHSVKASALEEIVATFPAQLTVEPVLVFVVPPSQSPYAAHEMNPKDHKYSKWSQFSMCMDDDRLWGSTVSGPLYLLRHSKKYLASALLR